MLVVGCGDVGSRIARRLMPNARVRALTSQADRAPALRALGITPIVGNLDQPHTLTRCRSLAPRILHLAPPPGGEGATDPRTRNLIHTLRRAGQDFRLVYCSTTGVYGHCADPQALWDESRPAHPQTSRAQRRVDAETTLRTTSRQAARSGHRASTSIARAPGIYGLDRPGGNPTERLKRGTPVLWREDDVHTNHIHAEDLARACIAALWRGTNTRAYNACDDSDLHMGDYFDLAADLAGLPRPERISMAEARLQLSPVQLSFWSESRRLSNRRLKSELRVSLLYPTVREGLAGLQPDPISV